MTKLDPLTGNSYDSEFRMYMRYHGFSQEEAAFILEAVTYKERDRRFGDIVQKRWDQTHAQEKSENIEGYIRLLTAIGAQIDADGCQCEKCQTWLTLRNKWVK